MLDLRLLLGLGFLDLAERFLQGTALAMFLVETASSRYLPDDLAASMFRTFFDQRNTATLMAVTTTLFTRPDSASAPMWAFAPKQYWFPFLVWCISESRLPSWFLGSVASRMVPWRSDRPWSPSNC